MKKIPVWKNIILIFSLLVTIIIATLAWFLRDRNTRIGLDVQVGRATYIQISADGGESWSDDLMVDIGLNKKFKEISGDGTTFFQPVYELAENSEGVLESEIVTFERVTDETKYYERVFSFRSDTDQTIYLSPESFVQAIANEGNNCIDGAIRVAFFELDENEKETLKYIWAPNSLIEYSAVSHDFVRVGEVESNYYYQKSVVPVDVGTLAVTSDDVVVIPTADSGECLGCGYDKNNKFMWSCGDELPENAPSLLSITVPDGEEFGYSSMKVRVWLEGHDRECVSLLSNQKFTMKFQFGAKKGE